MTSTRVSADPVKTKIQEALMGEDVLSVSVPSFGAEHVVTHSARIAGKDTYKAVVYSVKEIGKAGKSFLKIAF